MTATITLPTTMGPLLLDAFEEFGVARRYKAGETIFSQGDPAERLGVLLAGEIALEMHLEESGPVRFFRVGPGELYGWSALLDPKLETATAIAVHDCEVVEVRGWDLLERADADPRTGREMFRTLARLIMARLGATRTEMAELLVR